MTMWWLALGLAVFIGLHLIPSAPGVKSGLVERFGESTYRIIYSVGAIVSLVLIIFGYAVARPDAPFYYEPSTPLKIIGGLLMLPAFILFPAARLAGWIKRVAKHPQLAAVKIWAFAHLLMNGDGASLLLFGAFLAWAVYARVSYKWRETATPTKLPIKWSRPDTIATVIGLVLYGIFIAGGHEFLIGVPATG